MVVATGRRSHTYAPRAKHGNPAARRSRAGHRSGDGNGGSRNFFDLREKTAKNLDAYRVIGSKELAFTLPGSAYVLDDGDIHNLNYENINQVLRQIPGVYVREEDGYGNFPNISIRGVDGGRSAKVTLMEDGVLTAPAPYAAPAAYYSPPIGRMSGLEVFKGIQSGALWPGDHRGGAQLHCDPDPDREKRGFRPHVPWAMTKTCRPTSGVGEPMTSRAANWACSVNSTAGRPTASANWTRRPPFFGPRGTAASSALTDASNWPLSRTGKNTTNSNSSSGTRISTPTMAISDSALKISVPIRCVATRAVATTRSTPTARRPTLRHTVDLEEDWRLVTTGYYQEFNRDWYKLNDLTDPDVGLSEALFNGTPGYQVLTGQAAGELRYRSNNRNYELYGIQSDLNGAFETGELRHEISTGLRLHHDYEDRFQHQDVYTQNDQGAFVSVDRGAPGSQANRKSSATALAAYVQDRIVYEDWAIIPGLRYEYIDYEVDNRASGSTKTANLDVLTPGIGLEYNINPRWMAFAGYYRGFSAPGPSGAVKGIKEETSDSFELGARYRNTEGLRAELVGFYTFFNDLLVAESIGSGTLDDENVGNAISRGIEALVAIDPARMNDQALQYADHARGHLHGRHSRRERLLGQRGVDLLRRQGRQRHALHPGVAVQPHRWYRIRPRACLRQPELCNQCLRVGQQFIRRGQSLDRPTRRPFR